MKTDLLIIGGGPAGLQAAFEPATKGVKVTIVDESFSFGGQLRHQTQFLNQLPQPYGRVRGTTLRERLIDRLRPFDIEWLPNHTMIGTYKDGRIGFSDGNNVIPVQAKKSVIATGAAEEAIIFPGWTLPGVMTIGAAQILMNRECVLPGKDAIILGSNDFSLEVAQQLNDVGVKVHGIVERHLQLCAKNTENIKKIKELNFPVFLNAQITRAQGSGRVQTVYIKHGKNETVLDVDLICIGGGLSPILEPFEILGCELTYQKDLGGWLPKYDENLETSNHSIYVAGNSAGVTNMGGILVTGEIAGVSVLESLEVLQTKDVKEIKQKLWKELYRIECAYSKNTFEARLAVIKDFCLESGKPLPTQPDLFLEGV